MLAMDDVLAAVKRAQFFRGTGVMVFDRPGPQDLFMVLAEMADGRWRLYVAADDNRFVVPVTFLRSIEIEELATAIEEASLAVFARLQAERATWN